MKFKIRRTLMLIVVIGLALSGCSIKMAYNNLDRLVRWRVSDYVDLHRAQKEVLQRELSTIHAWHRVNHLPQYAELVGEMAKQLPDGVSVTRVADMFEQLEFWADEVEQKFTPLVIEIIVSLSDEQVIDLKAKLEDSNDELAQRKSKKTLRETQLLWAEEFVDRLKNFTGKLDKSQQVYLERRSLEYLPERALWAEYRSRFQADLLALIEQRQEHANFDAAYRALVASRKGYYGAELASVFANNQRLNQAAAAYILSSLSDQQSARFVQALRDLGEDFTELSQRV